MTEALAKRIHIWEVKTRQKSYGGIPEVGKMIYTEESTIEERIELYKKHSPRCGERSNIGDFLSPTSDKLL